jgi:homoserine acetyltransferase
MTRLIKVLMGDPHWNRGEYYNSVPPHAGMKLAREIATITYRSGPEWDARFGRTRLSPDSPPAFCADYQIERYLDWSGEKWWRGYDANSMLYISKAMDLFDMSASVRARPAEAGGEKGGACLPSMPYELGPQTGEPVPSHEEQIKDLTEGFRALSEIPTLVIGAASDILFPAKQQREIVECLSKAGNEKVDYIELSEKESLFGHDSFLKIGRVGEEIGRFLDRV